MKTIYILFTFIVVLTGCEQGEVYTSQKTVYGEINYDTIGLGVTSFKPADSIVIRLKTDKTGEKGDYLYEVKSDKDGLFEFTFIPNKTEFYVEAIGTLEGIEYKAIDPLIKANAKSIVIINPKFNYALKVILSKTDGSKANALHNVKTFLYKNATLADAAYNQEGIPDKGFIDSKTTNENGIVIYNNLVKDTEYYIVIKDEISNVKLKAKEKRKISPNKAEELSILSITIP